MLYSPPKIPDLITPCLYQVRDHNGHLWNVGEERPTEHGWELLLGWPALDTKGRGESGGGRRVIITKELVVYLESTRMTPGKAQLPICEDTLRTLRRKLGMSYRADRKKWWEEVECELCSPSPQFAAVHSVSTTTVMKQRRKRGISPSKKRWTEEDSSRLLRLSAEGYDITALAEALGRTEAAVKEQRRVLSGGTVQPYTEPRLRWTEAEKKRLVEMVRAGYRLKEIAAELGRTRKAVLNMSSSMLGDTRQLHPWTEEDKQQVLQLALSGHAEGDIARITGRQLGSVSAMRGQLMRAYKQTQSVPDKDI